jgi:hypothetical protein
VDNTKQASLAGLSGRSVPRVTRPGGHDALGAPVEPDMFPVLRVWRLWCRMQDDLPDFGDDAD